MNLRFGLTIGFCVCVGGLFHNLVVAQPDHDATFQNPLRTTRSRCPKCARRSSGYPSAKRPAQMASTTQPSLGVGSGPRRDLRGVQLLLSVNAITPSLLTRHTHYAQKDWERLVVWCSMSWAKKKTSQESCSTRLGSSGSLGACCVQSGAETLDGRQRRLRGVRNG